MAMSGLRIESTSLQNRPGDMVYSEARRLRMLGVWARTTMLYALEENRILDQRLQFLSSYQKEEMSVADPCRAYRDLASNGPPLDQSL